MLLLGIQENSNNKTHQVAKKTANELGLYDMSGNVWEWVWDEYKEDSYQRLYSGGCWDEGSENCVLSDSGRDDANARYYGLGFRLLRGF